jgi:hypothetical protein
LRSAVNVSLLSEISNLRLSREERKTYLDEADQFYADPEGFIKKMAHLPQRLVFFDVLTPRLDLLRKRYNEVCIPEITADASAHGSSTRGSMMTRGGKEMS